MTVDGKNESLLTVAVCTYNRAAWLIDTVEGLSRQRCDFSKIEVLIINNNSSDNTATVISDAINKYPDIPISGFVETRQGLSHARNKALEEAKSEYVLYIDDDVYLPDNFLESWIRFLAQNRGISAAGGPINVHFDDGQPTWFPMLLAQMLGYHRPYTSNKRYSDTLYPHGGNMVVHRNLALQINGFDPRLGRTGKNLAGGEEKDFFNRLRKINPDIYYNSASFLHHRIGNERLTREFIKKQALGIGKSNRILHNTTGESIRWIIKQLMKSVASIGLAAGYLITFRPLKAFYLLAFRIWILRGYSETESGTQS